MTQTALDILTALVFLSVKHTIADFFLQLPYQHKNKGTYGHPGGILHSSIQAVCSIPVFFILTPPSFFVAGAILFAEFFVHYHVDWLKVNFNKWYNLNAKTEAFWYAVGVDQLLHQLTYIGMIAALLAY